MRVVNANDFLYIYSFIAVVMILQGVIKNRHRLTIENYSLVKEKILHRINTQANHNNMRQFSQMVIEVRKMGEHGVPKAN